jgi:4-amino-4-deoxy-L-arabinose transferase-like glycosyltransferase
LVFLGWVGLYGGVFSYAHGIYHSYYTSAMAPGVAALAGVGSVTASSAIRQNKWWLIVLAGLVGITVWTQLQIEGRTPDFYGWVRPLTMATALAGLAAVLAFVLWSRQLSSKLVNGGIALSVAGLLLLPAAWSVSAAANASLNATLPQAGPQAGASGATFGSSAFDDGSAELAAWIKANSAPDVTWNLVVPNAMSGSRLIAEYGLSVMSLGGFIGTDNTISVKGFADLVSSGEVRYVLVQSGGLGGGFGGGLGGTYGGALVAGVPGASTSGAEEKGSDAVLPAVQSACSAVTDPGLPSTYQGSLYDCAGKADALRTQGS